MTELKTKKKILIIGITGGLAQITARLLLDRRNDIEVIGIDARDTEKCDQVEGLTCQTMKFSRGNFESLFRDHEFDTVFHLARISSSNNSQDNLKKRLALGVMGTSRILDLCQRFTVRKVVILSTFHVYGALADNSVFLKESAPLKASINFPQLRDVVEMDQICTSWMWKNQNDVSTVVLRPCNIIGNKVQNAMTLFLTSPVVLKPIDFNPMFQFIHEFDMARILVECVDNIQTGIYNVSPDDFIALKDAIDTIGAKTIPFPIFLGKSLNNTLKKVNLDVPNYFIDYLKFSCLISNNSLKKYIGDHFFRFEVNDSLKLLRLN
jgi:UDP-glucose 4-epimerase